MDKSNDTWNTDDQLVTDWSVSKSTSLSGMSSDRSLSSDELHTTTESGRRHNKRRRTRKGQTELIPPDVKLKKCEKRYKTYLGNGDTENAFTELLKFVPLVRLVHGDQHWKYANAVGKLARGYLDKKYGVQAVKHAEKAKTLILSCDPPREDEKVLYVKCIVEIYLWLGKALTLIGGKAKDAENALLKAWQVLKSICGDKQKVTIQIPSGVANKENDDVKKEIKMAMGELYTATKQSDKAVSSLQFVVKLVKTYSENDESLIDVYSKLAKAEKSRKKSEINYDTIIEYSLKAHEISMACHALSSVEVADTAFALGKAYAGIDADETQNTAATYFTEAMNVYRNTLGERDAKTIKAQDALCQVWMRTGKEEDAIKTLKKSIPGKVEAFGECSAQVSKTYKLIGGVYLSQGDLANTHKYLTKCLTIETELHGSQHWKTSKTRDTINIVMQNPAFAKTKGAKLADRPKFTSTIKIVNKK